MSKNAVVDQIAGIFARNDVPYGLNEEGTYRVLRGSAAIFIDVRGDDDSTAVCFTAPVVEKIDLEGEMHGKGLWLVNDLNCRSMFGRYCLYTDNSLVMLEHEILGDDLQASELLSALDSVSEAADGWDDKLSKELGGKTYEAVEMETSGGAIET
jgi:hypothetical protein